MGDPLRLAKTRATSPGGPGEERAGSFALGFGVGRGFGAVLEDVVGADEGEGLGLGLDNAGARGVDALDEIAGAVEGGGLEELGEFVEGEMVELAEVEGGDGGVEEVFEELVGEGGRGIRDWGLGIRKTPYFRFAGSSP
ncbi:MAG: hypothetical protein KDA29_09500 [Phycisphaerales bacterium]|nr:hypothetical protein [Phycisphaerales bacterium]